MLLIAVFGFVGSLWAQSPFDGTWKIDINTVKLPDKPEIWSIQKGIFQCPTCDPKADIKADGIDQPIQGSNEIDTMAVKVVDDKTVEITTKKGGKVGAVGKHTVSADGKTETIDRTEYPGGGKQPVTFKETYIRIAAGPSGSHAFSGTWRAQKVNTQGMDLTVTYKSTPNGIMLTGPMGESFDAKFDGKDYPIKGATGGTVLLTKVNDRSIDETHKQDGKVVTVVHATVSADGKTLTVKEENKPQGTTITATATKQ